jgi:hypothetical protein
VELLRIKSVISRSALGLFKKNLNRVLWQLGIEIEMSFNTERAIVGQAGSLTMLANQDVSLDTTTPSRVITTVHGE